MIETYTPPEDASRITIAVSAPDLQKHSSLDAPHPWEHQSGILNELGTQQVASAVRRGLDHKHRRYWSVALPPVGDFAATRGPQQWLTPSQ